MQPAKRCRSCNYALDGRPEPRCPECGPVFSFDDPRSFHRVLLTGIHLMRTGEVEANLLRLNETFRLPYIADLVARKTVGGEQTPLPDADFDFHARDCARLTAELEQARDASKLPPAPTARPALNDLLLRRRGVDGANGPA